MKIKTLLSNSPFRHTAIRRAASLFLTGVATIVFQGLVVQTAFAHSLTVAATAVCSNGAPVINYTVTSWNQNLYDTSGENPEVQVYFNGALVDTESFLDSQLPEPDQFSSSKPSPAATGTVNVEAIAAGTWSDLFPGGQTNTVTVTIPTSCAPGTGRFTGGGKQVVTAGDLTVTYGFEVDCDLHQPSNNLEINWGGNHFHMENFMSAVCTYTGPPNPPKAPVNKIVGMGTGRYNGVEGYTVVFTLIDNGEPGKNDESGFMVYQTSNPSNVVLNLPLQFITKGNIQAHVDQH